MVVSENFLRKIQGIFTTVWEMACPGHSQEKRVTYFVLKKLMAQRNLKCLDTLESLIPLIKKSFICDIRVFRW